MWERTLFVHAPQGNVERMIGISEDISHRKNMEELLRTSEERYRAIVEDQTELICRFRPDGDINFVNNACCRYFGKQREHLLATSFFALLPETEHPNITHCLNSLSQQKPTQVYEHKISLADETPRWLQWTHRAIFDTQENVVEFQSVGRDITLQKQAEQELKKTNDELDQRVHERTEELYQTNHALQQQIEERKRIEADLRASEERYRGIVEDQTELICRLKPDGTFTFVNEAYARHFSTTSQAMIGTSFLALIPPEKKASVRTFLQSFNPAKPVETSMHSWINEHNQTCWQHWTHRALLDEQQRVVEIQSVGHDITERMQAEEAYKKLVDHSLQGLIIFQENRPIFANSKMADITGYHVDELIAMPSSDAIVHPEDLPIKKQLMHDVQVDKTSRKHYEFRIFHKSGELRWLEISVAPTQYQGKPAMQAACVDITKRKQAEELLRESEEQYRTLVEMLPGAVLMADLDGTIRFCNQQTAYLFGYSNAEALCGKNGSDLLDSACMSSNPINILNSILASGKTKNLEYLMRRKDGTNFPAEVSSTVIRDTHGCRKALIVVIQDISERKQSDQQLYQAYNNLAEIASHVSHNKSILQAVVEGVEDGLLLIDEKGYVQMVNQAMVKLLGTTRDTLLNKEWKSMYPRIAPDFPGYLAIEPSSHDHKHYRERRYRDSDGIVHILNIQIIKPTNKPHQRVKHTLMHVADVTEHTKLQQQLLENDRFVANGKLAASVAHEINTPLQSLKLFVDLARVASEEKRQGYLKQLKDEIQRIGQIANNLLDLYRPGANTTCPLQINTLIERLLLMVGKRIMDQEVQIERNLAQDLPDVWGRSDEFMQVLLNLMVNALDAMPEGGRLEIATTAVTRNALPAISSSITENGKSIMSAPSSSSEAEETNGEHAPADMFVVITIRDTGSGIAPELQERIFEPFMTTREEGTGLGLAISKQIVTQHHGHIIVQSQPGQGSTFMVLLPARTSENGSLPCNLIEETV
jgi:PAS domain S-box-containing protein